MKNSIIFFATWMLILVAKSQGNVILHSGGTSTLFFGYYGFYDAYGASKSGDTIYLSGGEYAISGTISRKLTIIGAGYHPDSTKATRTTILDGSVVLANGSSGTWLEGLYVTSSIYVNSYDTAHNIRVHRCFAGSLIQTEQRGGLINYNFTITECNFLIFNGGNSVSNLYIGNSIIRSAMYNINKPALIENNYFVTGAYSTLIYNLQWVTFRNNIVNNSFWPGGNVLSGVYNSKFRNNLWTNTPGGSYTSNDTLKETIGVVPDSIFINAPGYGFEWYYNYHLKAKTASQFRGTDGSEIGLYGGTISPFKEGGVPRNPHIQSAVIDEKTDASGKLKINLKVQAQKR